MTLQRILIALLGALITGSAMAHGGGLDKYGCHTDRKTGNYHCHGKQERVPDAPLNLKPMPLLAASIRYPMTDLDVLLVVHHLLVALGYIPTSTPPSGTITMDVRAAVAAFRRDRQLTGGDKIDGTLLLQLSEAVATNCSPRRRAP